MSYGKGGDAYPIESGDVWLVGQHVLICGDLEQGVDRALVEYATALGLPAPKLLYTDPPWTTAWITNFRNRAGAGVSPQLTWETLMQRLLALVPWIQGPAFFEMGLDGIKELQRLAAAADHPEVGCWRITYDRRRTCVLLGVQAWGTPNRAGFYMPDFTGVDDLETPSLAIQRLTQPGDVVVDPCLGLGTTSRAAALLDRRCLASELHPRRLSCAINDLVKKFGLRAEKVGNFVRAGTHP